MTHPTIYQGTYAFKIQNPYVYRSQKFKIVCDPFFTNSSIRIVYKTEIINQKIQRKSGLTRLLSFEQNLNPPEWNQKLQL